MPHVGPPPVHSKYKNRLKKIERRKLGRRRKQIVWDKEQGFDLK